MESTSHEAWTFLAPGTLVEELNLGPPGHNTGKVSDFLKGSWLLGKVPVVKMPCTHQPAGSIYDMLGSISLSLHLSIRCLVQCEL